MEISKEKLIAEVKKEAGQVDSAEEVQKSRQRLEDSHLLAQQWADIIRMRRGWSSWILAAICAIVVFDFVLIIGIGTGWLQFPDGFVVPAIITESIVKTLGLAAIVVKFLFNKDTLGKG